MKTSPEDPLAIYSVVIHPPDEAIDAVARLKQRLEDKIGWYHSVHSLAHITFNVFRSRWSNIATWENYLASFSNSQLAMPVSFDRPQGFSNGSFVLLANEQTDTELKEMMRSFNNNRPKGPVKKSQRPHLTIGRKLNVEQMNIAKALIQEASIEFLLDKLVLRRLNLDKGQYDIINTFPFKQQ
ncbi:MAG: hypothetical protein BGO31_09495 [Bacteroidetes bacterium 43-16]|nr:MAG: hypothetical protein BGO31_09495 [Bacteroidetes bacterium 43-16]